MNPTIAILAASVLLTACGEKAPGAQANAPAPAPVVAQTPPPPPPPPAPPPAPKKWDGPLGLVMGLSKAEIEAAGISLTANPDADGLFSAQKTPEPNKSFEDVNYVIGDKSGLCKVFGTTKIADANRSGDQIKSTFNELEEALTEKYGKPKRYMFAKAGALWKEDMHWMKSLSADERVHTSIWNGANKNTLPPGIDDIVLKAVALSDYRGYVNLGYEYSNMTECVKEIKKARNSSL